MGLRKLTDQTVIDSESIETANMVKVKIKCPFNLANSDNSSSGAGDKRYLIAEGGKNGK